MTEVVLSGEQQNAADAECKLAKAGGNDEAERIRILLSYLMLVQVVLNRSRGRLNRTHYRCHLSSSRNGSARIQRRKHRCHRRTSPCRPFLLRMSQTGLPDHRFVFAEERS
jgi:hypothetical protein